jgi:uncharacterized protein
MKDKVYETIEKWLSKTIVELNLCPFAKIPWQNSQIRLCICDAPNEDQAYPSFVEELERLHASEEFITTIIAYPNFSMDFFDFNDWLGELEQMLSDNDLDDSFQLVAFHPQFVFDQYDHNDLANWVNRSPYPVVHILRFSDVQKALLDENFAKKISYTNEQNIKNLTDAQKQEYFWYLYP